jgi:hypothetical protein
MRREVRECMAGCLWIVVRETIYARVADQPFWRESVAVAWEFGKH